MTSLTPHYTDALRRCMHLVLRYDDNDVCDVLFYAAMYRRYTEERRQAGKGGESVVSTCKSNNIIVLNTWQRPAIDHE